MLKKPDFDKNQHFVQASRRHRIRNLRAKVKALLPIEICCKHQQRNSKVKNILQKMNKYQSQAKIDQWRGCSAHCDEYFFENNAKPKGQHMFQSLSKEEIQQINEDKFYYIGDQRNIAFYEQFLSAHYPEMTSNYLQKKTKQSSRNLFLAYKEFDSIQRRKQTMTDFQEKKIPNEFEFQRKTHFLIPTTRKFSSSLHKIDTKTKIFNSTSQMFYRETSHQNKRMNQKNIQRRQQLQEQRKIKRQIASMHLKQRHNQADQKRSALMSRKMDFLKKKSTIQAQKIRKANILLSTKYNMMGQITNLTQNLRRVCLSKHKFTKSEVGLRKQ